MIEALNEMDIEIPKKNSSISLYDHEVFPFISPKVSANKTPYKEIVECTIELLIKQINGGDDIEVETVELLSELVERSSC
jgi:DNA-binding LacI/PurR family transcriptional regulator